MTADERKIRQLAAAVADGLPVDWRQAETTSDDESERAVVQQLRLLASLADVHRTGEATVADDGWSGSGSMPHEGDTEPTQWGPLEIRELVGSGGYGTVYRAWDPQLHREVALKLLNDDRASDPIFQQSVIAEGRRLARVRHQNVIAVYGADSNSGRVGFWMEFLEGQTLKQWLDSQGALNSREATLIGIELCRALAAVHAAGLVHRDVKAQNVMREAGGRTVLMDFGTGSETGQRARLAGTPLYMAPELFTGSIPSHSSDIYSLGVLLFYLVSNEFPVAGATLDVIKRAHAAGTRRTVRDVRPDLPSAFVRVVDRALSPDPAARPATAGALEAELAASLELHVESARRRQDASGVWRALAVVGDGDRTDSRGARQLLDVGPDPRHARDRAAQGVAGAEPCRAASREPLGRLAGLLQQRDDRTADGQSVEAASPSSHRAQLGHEIQGRHDAAPRSGRCAARGCADPGLRAARRRPSPCDGQSRVRSRSDVALGGGV